MAPQGEKPVLFDPQEYLRLVRERMGKKSNEFGVLIGKSVGFEKDFFRSKSQRLPEDLAVTLAGLSATAPFNEPLYWLQSKFPISSVTEIAPLEKCHLKTKATWQETVQSNTKTKLTR